jgi:hypothetical protein
MKGIFGGEGVEHDGRLGKAIWLVPSAICFFGKNIRQLNFKQEQNGRSDEKC